MLTEHSEKLTNHKLSSFLCFHFHVLQKTLSNYQRELEKKVGNLHILHIYRYILSHIFTSENMEIRVLVPVKHP